MERSPSPISTRGPTVVPRLLVVTNDFPPRVGGIQRYVHDVVRHLPPERVAVFAPRWPECLAFDRAQPYPVYRFGGTFMAPIPDVTRRVHSLIRETEAEMVLFGHGLPLGAMGPGLSRSAGVPYAILTHGAEVWMGRVPGTRRLLARASAAAAAVFAVSAYTRDLLRPAVPEHVSITLLPPGVDPVRFSPKVDGRAARERHRLADRPTVACVSRLVRRKGQDTLIRAWPRVRSRLPDAALLLVGDGPIRGHLEVLARRLGVGDSIVFAGEVADADLPAYYAAGDVFAMPCRSRVGGLEVEGFGIVFLEAAACGRAAVAGDSGGAAEAVEDGTTGLVVDGSDPRRVGGALIELLEDRPRARAMGAAGRARVVRDFTWPALVERMIDALSAGRGGAA